MLVTMTNEKNNDINNNDIHTISILQLWTPQMIITDYDSADDNDDTE